MISCLTGRSSRMFALLLLVALPLAAPVIAFADSLSGRVVDPMDRAVAGARVIVLRGQTVAGTATTDNEGRFGPLTLAPDKYDLVVSAPGLRLPTTSVTIAQGASETVTLKLALAA